MNLLTLIMIVLG